MGTGTALTPPSGPRVSLRGAVGWAVAGWGAALLVWTMWWAGVPPPESLERTRGTVETLEATGGALHFTLAGQGLQLRYLRRGGEIGRVQRLLEEARSQQVLLLFAPGTGVVYDIEGASGARRYEEVRDAWRDKNGTDAGLGLALMFIGARLAFGRR